MGRAMRKWKNALPGIGFLCLAFTLAVAIYTYRYEPARYVAEYTFFALPAGVQADDDAQTAARLLARDCDALLRTASFREGVLATVPSDGKTRLSAATANGAHMIRVRAVGENPEIVTGLANGAGRALVNGAGELFRATEAREMEAATLPLSPGGLPKPVKVAGALAASFLVFSLLGMLLGSSRQPVRFRRNDGLACGLPCLGAVADCEGALRRQTGRAAGKPRQTLYDSVSPLVRENVRGVSLALRAAKGRGGCVAAVAGLEADESNAAFSLLLASELACQGYDVLLMELDATLPTLGRLLHVQGACDLGDCLQNEAALRQAILPTPVPRLCFMDLYRDRGFVASVAATEAFASFLSDAAHSFDYVVLNAPAAPYLSDAAMVGGMADVMLMVVPDGRYTAEEIEDGARELTRVEKRLGGFVLIRTPKRRFGRNEVRMSAARC